MPWEKSFNVDTAIEDAMQVFWDKGYEQTSVTDLLAGTGLNKGSLYNAFGGKKQLFVKALQKYDEERRAMFAELEALDDPQQAIGKLFDNIVATTVADAGHKGCFLFNTALQINMHGEEVSGIVTKGVKEIEAFFRRSIEVGQARGQIPKELVAEDTAKALLAMIVGIRLLGRGVFTQAPLRTIADQAKRLIA